MKNLLSLSLAGILSLVGCWFAPAQAMLQQNIAPENREIPAKVLVEELVGYRNEYSAVSDSSVMFTPVFTNKGKLYKHLKHQNGRWHLQPDIVWKRQELDGGIYMTPIYYWRHVNNLMRQAGLMYSRNTYDPYGSDTD